LPALTTQTALESFKNQSLFHEGMAEKDHGLGPVKRFGVRYGRTVKVKRAAVEIMKKQSTKCPYCNKDKVERKSKGIWHCTKCRNTFTGQAYTFAAKPAALPPVEQVLAEIEKPAEEETEAEV
jgi:large subunit ribosomal protein L37Ae